MYAIPSSVSWMSAEVVFPSGRVATHEYSPSAVSGSSLKITIIVELPVLLESGRTTPSCSHTQEISLSLPLCASSQFSTVSGWRTSAGRRTWCGLVAGYEMLKPVQRKELSIWCIFRYMYIYNIYIIYMTVLCMYVYILQYVCLLIYARICMHDGVTHQQLMVVVLTRRREQISDRVPYRWQASHDTESTIPLFYIC